MHIMNARKKKKRTKTESCQLRLALITSHAPFFQLVSQTPYFLLLVSIIKRLKVIFKTYKFKKER